MINYLNKFNKLNIVVVGDLILDIFSYGTINRISPEAPVPVINIVNKKYYLGGAGNVAKNLSSLGINTYLFSVIGNSDYNSKLFELFDERISPNIITDLSRITTRKERYISSQQILRVDTEVCDKITLEDNNSIINSIKKLNKEIKIDALIFSDYNKGVLSTELVQDLVNYSNENNILTFLDPKPGSLGIINNLTVLKPNKKELSELTYKYMDIYESSKYIYHKYNPKYLIVSLSSEGCLLYDGIEFTKLPSKVKEVYDVSGAGDTLLSVIASFMSSGLDIINSIKLGNIAAGIVISKLGTSIVTKDELLNSIK